MDRELTYQQSYVLDDLRRLEIACRKVSLMLKKNYKLMVDPKAVSIIGESVFGLSPYKTYCEILKFQEEKLV